MVITFDFPSGPTSFLREAEGKRASQREIKTRLVEEEYSPGGKDRQFVISCT